MSKIFQEYGVTAPARMLLGRFNLLVDPRTLACCGAYVRTWSSGLLNYEMALLECLSVQVDSIFCAVSLKNAFLLQVYLKNT